MSKHKQKRRIVKELAPICDGGIQLQQHNEDVGVQLVAGYRRE